MFTFNLFNVIEILMPKKAHENEHKLLSPGEIRRQIEKLSRCPHCHFLIFDNYWSDEIENPNLKVCPTCGYKL